VKPVERVPFVRFPVGLPPELRTSFPSLRALVSLFVGFVVCFGLFESAQAETVVLVLKNGDRISGTLVSENAQRVTLQSTAIGKLKIPADQIKGREFPDRPKPSPTPSQAATPSTPAQVAGKPPAPISASTSPSLGTNRVAQTRLQRVTPNWLDPFMTNWHGNIQIGLDLGYGTTDRQTYYANASATHAYGRMRNFADLHAAYGFVNEVESAKPTTPTPAQRTPTAA